MVLFFRRQLVVLVPLLGALVPLHEAAAAVVVQGESAARTNIPVAKDRRASGGRYLALDTAKPAGWNAGYTVKVPKSGPYRLDLVATHPALPDRDGGSAFSIKVNDGAMTPVARSEPFWAATPAAWGTLARIRLDDVDLRRGNNTITFQVDEPRLNHPPKHWHFLLDQFTVTPTVPALKSVHVGDPATNLGVYRDKGTLHFQLNTASAQTVHYEVADYREITRLKGQVKVEKEAATLELPELPPGAFRVTAWLGSTPQNKVIGRFARLPGRRPADESRFGATFAADSGLMPTSKLTAMAHAMKEAGIGTIREEIPWPIAEPSKGRYDTTPYEDAAARFHEQGIRTLHYWGSFWGEEPAWQAPKWAMGKTSAPLPDDLRDAYAFAHHLAGRFDALEIWNEPDINPLSELGLSTARGDQFAAYFKAAALGIADHPDRPDISLPGLGFPGAFQQLLLRNEVTRYADIWNFHGYADKYRPGGLSKPPAVSKIENELAGARGISEVWMTESGLFVPPKSKQEDLTPSQQRDQARYLVQSAVEDLAAGSDRHFWFSAAPYCATQYACFGLLDRDFQPWASYSAHAAMASLLGKANYVGRAQGLPEGVTGHVFTSDTRQVTVLWSDRPRKVNLKGEAYDLMGAPFKGLIHEPVYLVTKGRSGQREARPQKRPLSDAEHIVLSQRYPEGSTPEPFKFPWGYRVGKKTRMTLDVYNFTDTPQTVRVTTKSEAGWTISPAGRRTIRIPAQGRVSVPYDIFVGTKVRPGVDYSLIFEATLGERRVPPSAARVFWQRN